jgi:hypothetical protein
MLPDDPIRSRPSNPVAEEEEDEKEDGEKEFVGVNEPVGVVGTEMADEDLMGVIGEEVSSELVLVRLRDNSGNFEHDSHSMERITSSSNEFLLQ